MSIVSHLYFHRSRRIVVPIVRHLLYPGSPSVLSLLHMPGIAVLNTIFLTGVFRLRHQDGLYAVMQVVFDFLPFVT